MKFKIILSALVMMFACKVFSQDKVINKGDSLFVLGNYSKAIEVYKNNNPSEHYEKIAEAYMGIGNYDQSITYFSKAITHQPENILVKYKYAKLLARIKKDEEALNMFQELLKLDNQNPNYHYELGVIFEKQKDNA